MKRAALFIASLLFSALTVGASYLLAWFFKVPAAAKPPLDPFTF